MKLVILTNVTAYRDLLIPVLDKFSNNLLTTWTGLTGGKDLINITLKHD
jgi:hypothetical protein